MSPLERYYKLPKTKQDLLISAARSEFASHGFERASYNRIIETAQVSKGAMYYYFADKADLFGEVIDRLLAELVEGVGPLREPVDADDFWAALWEWVQGATALTLSVPDLGVLARALYHDTGAQGVVTRVRDRVHSLLEVILADGQRLGAVREDVPTDLLAVALTHLLLGVDRWFADHLEELDPTELERLSGKTLDLCRDLAAPKERPS